MEPGEGLWDTSWAEADPTPSFPFPSLGRRAAARGEEPGVPADRGAAGRLQDHAVCRERGRRRVSHFSIPIIPAGKGPGRRTALACSHHIPPLAKPAPRVLKHIRRAKGAGGDLGLSLNNPEPKAAGFEQPIS